MTLRPLTLAVMNVSGPLYFALAASALLVRRPSQYSRQLTGSSEIHGKRKFTALMKSERSSLPWLSLFLAIAALHVVQRGTTPSFWLAVVDMHPKQLLNSSLGTISVGSFTLGAETILRLGISQAKVLAHVAQNMRPLQRLVASDRVMSAIEGSTSMMHKGILVAPVLPSQYGDFVPGFIWW